MNSIQADMILGLPRRGGVMPGRKLSLEMAIREYFQTQDLPVSFFYRAPRAVKVTFRYAPNAFWTIESIMPDSLQGLSQENRDDWLYGSLIKKELPKVLKTIKQLHTNES